jgi:hypothetical protein
MKHRRHNHHHHLSFPSPGSSVFNQTHTVSLNERKEEELQDKEPE